MNPTAQRTILPRIWCTIHGSRALKRLKNVRTRLVSVEQQLLLTILDSAQKTVFGKKHSFSRIGTINDYRLNVPLGNYTSHLEYIKRMYNGESDVLFAGKPLFYTSSGGKTHLKTLPVSSYYYKTAIEESNSLWLYTTLRDNPRLLNGKFCAAIAPTHSTSVNDKDNCRTMAETVFSALPACIRRLHAVPLPLLCIPHSQARHYAMMRCALESNITWIIAPNPHLLHQFHATVVEHQEQFLKDIHDGTLKTDIASEIEPANRFMVLRSFAKNPTRARQLSSIFSSHGQQLHPKHYWPNLACITTWKEGNCTGDVSRLNGYFPPATVVREFGYQTQEVRSGIVLNNDWNYSLLPHHRFFFEFIDIAKRHAVSPPVLCASELETGKSYFIIVTNGSGLYRYDIGDIVRVTGFYDQFPLFEFIQKGASITNLHGEQLSETQLLRAVEEAGKETGLSPSFYTMFCDHQAHCYKFFAEFAPHLEQKEKRHFTHSLDAHLCFYNKEYAAVRGNDRVRQVELMELRQNAGDFMKNRLVDEGTFSEGTYTLCLLQDNTDLMEWYQQLLCSRG